MVKVFLSSLVLATPVVDSLSVLFPFFFFFFLLWPPGSCHMTTIGVQPVALSHVGDFIWWL